MSAKMSPRRAAARTAETLRYLHRQTPANAPREMDREERNAERYASKRTARRFH
jgi:hypothetical protein